MIYESAPWKNELARHLDLIRRWSGRSNTNRGYFLIERGIFLSSFVVRKLIENRKVTDKIRNKSIKCKYFKPFRPLSGRVTRFFGVADLSKEYNLEKPLKTNLSLFDLSSEIMHSYVFSLCIGEDGHVESFFVNSYRNQDDRLLEVDAVGYLKAASSVVSDRVIKIQVWADEKSGHIRAKCS